MKYFNSAALTVLLVCLTSGQGWNATVSTSLTSDQVAYADNYANKNGIHVLTIGSLNDSPVNNVRYNLLNSSGTIVRSYTFEGGGSFPCITGDNSNVYVMYWKNQTIRTWKSTDAGVNWSDGGIADITGLESYSSGIDAVMDNRGVHVAYGTRNASSGPYETYYKQWDGSNWVNSKNVTDYDANEVGGFPTVTSSTNKVHVSYNTGSGSGPSVNYGNAKTRDYNFTSQSWETPQQVYGSPSGSSMVEKIFVNGTTLHMFYYKIVSGMGQYHSDMYHVKRSVDGTTWDTPILIDDFADVNNKIEAAKTSDGNLHVIYPNYGLQYRIFNGTTWSSEQNISTYSNTQPYTMYSSGNDLYCFWKENGGINGTYINYRQYDAAPTSPVAMSIGTPNRVTVNWAWNPEPDINAYEVWRKYYRNRFDQQDWTLKVTPTTNSWADPDFQLNGSGDTYTVYYKTKAKDNTSQYSAYSSEISTSAIMVFWKNGMLTANETVPNEFELKQNYPNPFNPSTKITFALPEASPATVAVYDDLGREVAVLFTGELVAGTYTSTFDATKLSSGVYYVKFNAGKYSSVKKMLLTK